MKGLKDNRDSHGDDRPHACAQDLRCGHYSTRSVPPAVFECPCRCHDAARMVHGITPQSRDQVAT